MTEDLNKIRMVRGDQKNIIIAIDEGLDIFDFENGDKVYFTVAESIYSKGYIIRKVATNLNEGELHFKLEHEDTRDLDYKDYIYDIRLWKNGKPYDTINGGYFDFEIVGEVPNE